MARLGQFMFMQWQYEFSVQVACHATKQYFCVITSTTQNNTSKILFCIVVTYVAFLVTSFREEFQLDMESGL